MAEKKVNPIPEQYHTITPYLNVRGAKDALVFYREAFGAEEVECPFGHRWSLSTHVEDVSPEELDRRMKEMMGG